MKEISSLLVFQIDLLSVYIHKQCMQFPVIVLLAFTALARSQRSPMSDTIKQNMFHVMKALKSFTI